VEVEEDLATSLTYLIDKKYVVERLYQNGTTTGVVFALPHGLEQLSRHPTLTLMDATHQTQQHQWLLFTLYVRDTFGMWNIGAQFF
jgi:hypothetical protein